MGSVTCGSCGFVSFATSEVCKQCGNPLAAAQGGGPAWQAQGAAHPYAPVGFGQSKGMAAFALVCGLAGLPAMILIVALGMLLGGSPTACGLIGFLVFAVSSLLALILGITATMRANRLPTEFGGKGLAVAGIVLGGLALVSVVPIGIISAIAIPNLLAARRAANEGSAIGALRHIAEAEAAYQNTVGRGEFGSLEELRDAQLLDQQLSGGVMNGYRFEIEVYEGGSYAVTASPLKYPNTGMRSFYTSETGVIRAADKRGRPADENDAAITDNRNYGPRPNAPRKSPGYSSDGREEVGVGFAR